MIPKTYQKQCISFEEKIEENNRMEFRVTSRIAKVVEIVEIHGCWMKGICHFASEERCGAKIMILSGRLTRRLLRKQGTEKVIFRFPFFCLSLFLSSHPYSLSGKKFERVESMKGVENKGTTIVEGTKTSSLKFQRLASLRRKKNKKKGGKREKRKKTPCRHLERREKEGNRELPCTGRYISAETFRSSDFFNN